jgi:F-type H+-transporting ATPase subunit epsilon
MPIDLEIVSPERLLLSRPVEMVVIPAAEGEMGVLVQHSPMIVLLRGGTIRIYEGNQVKEQLYVAGGFAEITPERVTVLADEAQPVAEVSRAAAQTRLTEAQAQLAAVPRGDVPAEDAALVHVQAAQAMVAAAEAA